MTKDILENIKPDILSQITKDIGQVLFAGIFVGPIVSKSYSFISLLVGLVFSFVFWILSIYFNNKQKS